jgi:hypothetical protein
VAAIANGRQPIKLGLVLTRGRLNGSIPGIEKGTQRSPERKRKRQRQYFEHEAIR